MGDVNSTLACAIVAKKAGIPVAHVEAGLRSGDMSMPEEVNRIVTDSISDWFLDTEPAGVTNLLREGHPTERIRIFHVGHVMVDNVIFQARQLDRIDRGSYQTHAMKGAISGHYSVVTMHRPSNVDSPATLAGIGGALNTVAAELPLVLPVHPRTRSGLEKLQISMSPRIHLMAPQPYMSFLNLWKDAKLVLTVATCRRRPPPWAFRASQCPKTPKARSRSMSAAIRWQRRTLSALSR